MRRGEAFGFLGPNGAGKSSHHAHGRLRLAGHRAASCGSSASTRPPTARRSGPASGCVPQRDTLDEELTVEENLWIYGRYFGLSRHEVRARADELLEFAQLTERATTRSSRSPAA